MSLGACRKLAIVCEEPRIKSIKYSSFFTIFSLCYIAFIRVQKPAEKNQWQGKYYLVLLSFFFNALNFVYVCRVLLYSSYNDSAINQYENSD